MSAQGQTHASDETPQRQLWDGKASFNQTTVHGWSDEGPTFFGNNLTSATIAYVAEPNEPASLPRDDIAKRVAAEVAAVNKDGILFNCFMTDKEVMIQLPKSLVPEELQKFGQPVNISLGKINGIRVPTVEAREVEGIKDTFDSEMRAWLKSK